MYEDRILTHLFGILLDYTLLIINNVYAFPHLGLVYLAAGEVVGGGDAFLCIDVVDDRRAVLA